MVANDLVINRAKRKFVANKYMFSYFHDAWVIFEFRGNITDDTKGRIIWKYNIISFNTQYGD